ncbi:uncharacterized protein MKK02DRAFT_44125 [Dioszegia hungarica]|uniref:Uncharacterized protein n=1 Tax=Dioszegia hungarica TaxID=4972 RepID=A0AA38H8M2_9TREE|nr:uncharacterized protein MKK02DRAFT_44125 [Dioszegia hungarica]KAI9635436.1 hypothetical protein MKK02DRAFT_44125 [Dioszegia hungarica]
MSRTDMYDWMTTIVLRQKTHEFRKVLYPASVRRVWFYETSPISAIRYVCEIGPPVIRPSPSAGEVDTSPGSWLPDDGSIGNAEYNARTGLFANCDYAYPVLSCVRLKEAIPLARMREDYGIKLAPKGMIYVPEAMREALDLGEQEKVW